MKRFERSRFASAVALALGLAAWPFTASAATSPVAVKAAVVRAVQAFVAANPQSVGISIGIYEDGQVYTYNYGTTAPSGHIKPSSDTLYPIASITKTFTGALLAQAQSEGRLRLDDDIRKYLDGDYPNLEFAGHPIHLYDLVDHRSGLPFFLPDRAETRPDFKDGSTFSGRVAEIEKTYTRQDFFADLHKVKLTSPRGPDGPVFERRGHAGRLYSRKGLRPVLRDLGQNKDCRALGHDAHHHHPDTRRGEADGPWLR